MFHSLVRGFDVLFQLPDIYLFFLLSLFFVLISLLAIYIVKTFIPLDLRYKENSVIGYTTSLISLIYGVLVGLTALYLFNNNAYTAEAVQREADAVANFYRDSNWLEEPTRSNVQKQIQNYLHEVIEVEWPLMQRGARVTKNGDLIIDKIADLIYKNNITNSSILKHDMLNEIKQLYNARQARIHMSYSHLNVEIWIVILIGTFLTVCINYFFGMSIYLHMLTASAAALMVASMMFLLMTLDRPFQGDFSIDPGSLESVLASIQNTPESARPSQTGSFIQ